MKEKSKAQWPEGMKATKIIPGNDDPSAAFNWVMSGDDLCLVQIKSHNEDAAKHRGLQIIALPEMVALLKEGAEQTFTVGRSDDRIVTEYALKCKALLKQIGEAE